MTAYLVAPVRALLLTAALVFATQTVEAHPTAPNHPQTTSTARTKGDADATDRDGVPLGGVLIVIGIVGVVILLAWVCSRVGDHR
jgi:hypothetical protein